MQKKIELTNKNVIDAIAEYVSRTHNVKTQKAADVRVEFSRDNQNRVVASILAVENAELQSA